MSKIGVVGLGYVGTAIQKGFESTHNVLTYDIVKECTTKSITELANKVGIIFICVPFVDSIVYNVVIFRVLFHNYKLPIGF